MSADATRALKQVFLEEYGHFADKRIKNLDKGSLFIIDDRGPGDVGADHHLFLWFCLMFAEVADQNTVRIKLGGDVPKGVRVAEWLAENKVEDRRVGFEFDVRRGTQGRLTNLAKAFESIVQPGARYPVPSYKYVCPRVASALVRLQRLLDRAWGA
jgi:hypothetical protein